jgi:hypothetical protein
VALFGATTIASSAALGAWSSGSFVIVMRMTPSVQAPWSSQASYRTLSLVDGLAMSF